MSLLFKTLASYGESDYYPFHMPGHKRNMEGYENFSIYQSDITEIEGFDNLHQAEDILLDAQRRAAKLYKSADTFYLVNGSTCGILSSISATVAMGGKLLMSRNSHKAAYNAVMLRQLEVKYLYPAMIEEYNVFGGINPKDIEAELERDSSIEAIFITSPTADGIVSDVKEIANICHNYEKPLIVDEAHGAHFGFSPMLPKNAIENGADIVIHSVHKTLPAFTQTALLHCNSQLVEKEKLKDFLTIYQTSSPSYLLMAGIDQCIQIVSEEQETLFAKLEQNIEKFRHRCPTLYNIKVMDQSVIGNYFVSDLDLSKLVISVFETKLTGQKLYQILTEKYHLQMEMAAGSYVLGITTIMDTNEGFDRLWQALEQIDQELNQEMDRQLNQKFNQEFMQKVNKGFNQELKKDKKRCGQVATQREAIFSIYEASLKEKIICNISDATGKICGDFIVVYPPGLPMIVPGEMLTKEIVNQIEEYSNQGLTILGMKEMQIKIMK